MLAASDDLQVSVIDPAVPPPTVSINSPTDGAEINAPTAIVGTVSGGNWTLEYALGGDDTLPQTWTMLASGTGGFDNLIWPLLIISFGPTSPLIFTTFSIAPFYAASLFVALLLLSLQGSPETVRFCPGLDDMSTVREPIQQRFA